MQGCRQILPCMHIVACVSLSSIRHQFFFEIAVFIVGDLEATTISKHQIN